MPQTQLRVTLIDMSDNALALIYAACRQCYSAKSAAAIFAAGKDDPRTMEEFVAKVVASGHESPLEHVKFTFAIEGVSRALTHQLVRHRMASYSQQSQRYVKADDFDYIIPPSIEQDPAMKKEYIAVMETVQDGYNSLVGKFEKQGKKGEAVSQDARFVLPQGAATKIVVTMNCRELIHFFKERCCSRAQWEIRALANEILAICRKKLPGVFSGSGEKCKGLQYCPEGNMFSCGKYPLKEEVFSSCKK
ncbi:MAG: FAD-dependent thymidylate synthase [Candidatus Omnitrophica bacterium]|nr:FAD-dependent thymidylate synthase [Candidatus Omnitrophota bacterium]